MAKNDPKTRDEQNADKPDNAETSTNGTANTIDTGNATPPETTSQKAIALIQGSAFDGGIFGNLEVAAALTRPALSLKDDEPVAVRFDSPIFKGPDLNKKEEEKAAREDRKPKKITDMAPAYIANVTTHTGEEKQLLLPAVLKSVLEEAYCPPGSTVDDASGQIVDANGVMSDPGYVGKIFAVVARPKAEGKRYRQIEAKELKIKGDQVNSTDVRTCRAD